MGSIQYFFKFEKKDLKHHIPFIFLVYLTHPTSTTQNQEGNLTYKDIFM